MLNAHHWGGVFERMVKSTKRCLRKVIGRAHLSHDELLTAVTEIEAVINSRPLSYISANDLEEALTPSHLIVGRRILNLPDHIGYLCDSTDDEEFSINSTQLAKRVKHLSSTLNHFWNNRVSSRTEGSPLPFCEESRETATCRLEMS